MYTSDEETTWLEYNQPDDNWINQVRDRLKENIQKQFSLEEWNNDKVIQALESQEGIKELISYKLITQLLKI